MWGLKKMSCYLCRCCCTRNSDLTLYSPENSQLDLTKGSNYFIDKLFIHKVPLTVIETKEVSDQRKLEKDESNKAEKINNELSDEWTQTEEEYVKPNLVHKGTSVCLIETRTSSRSHHRRLETRDAPTESMMASKCDEVILDTLSKSVNQSVKLLQSLSCANPVQTDHSRNAKKKSISRQPLAIQYSRGEPNTTRCPVAKALLPNMEIIPGSGEEPELRSETNLHPLESELCFRSDEDSAPEPEYSEETYNSHEYACARTDTNYYSATVLPPRSRGSKNYESHLLLISNEERATRTFHGCLTEDKSGSPYFQRIPDYPKRSLKSTVAVHRVRDARRGMNVSRRLERRGNEHLTNLWNETRFNLNAEVMKDDDEKRKKKTDRPYDEEKKEANDSIKKSARSAAQSTQGQNEAGPSGTRSRKKDEKKEVSPSGSLASLIAKSSIKSVKSERDVIDDESSPHPTEELSQKPLYVNISGRNLSKKETVQILNKYSSIFVDNLKEPVPKDPLTYPPEDGDRPLPGTSARATDLANKLSEIGSQQFRQAPNATAYASSNVPQRLLSETASEESIQQIHLYEDETTQTKDGGKTPESESKLGKKLSTRLSQKLLKTKSRTSPQVPQESPTKSSSKRSPPKPDSSKTDKPPSSKQSSPKPDSDREPLPKDPTFHTRHIAVSNLDAERLAMRLEKLRKGRSASQQPPEFECDLASQGEDEQFLRPSSAVEPRFSPRQPLACSVARSSPCPIEEHRRVRMNPPQWDSYKSSPSGISQEVFPKHPSKKGRLSAERVEEEGWVLENHPVTPPRSPSRGSRGTKRWKIIIKHERASSSEDSLHDGHL